MGCASSKTVDVDVYRPPPSSFAVFDVAGIQEPWLKTNEDQDPHDDKNSILPAPVLEKLRDLDDGPRPWNEVSEVLEYLTAAGAPDSAKPPPPPPSQPQVKGSSIHTLEELESKISTTTTTAADDSGRPQPAVGRVVVQKEVPKSLKENMFIVRDRIEREKDGKAGSLVKRNPLSDFTEICPTGGGNAVALYTTSIGGVRRTHEDCNRIRQILESHQVVVDERDVALDGGFLAEMRELLGDGTAVPRLFVKGRYIGGVEEVVALNETGRLSRILNWAAVERGTGRMGCAGCGGARFVPCLECGGSRRVVGIAGKPEICTECNENGLLHCPLCI